jgi:hypothetical protein
MAQGRHHVCATLLLLKGSTMIKYHRMILIAIASTLVFYPPSFAQQSGCPQVEANKGPCPDGALLKIQFPLACDSMFRTGCPGADGPQIDVNTDDYFLSLPTSKDDYTFTDYDNWCSHEFNCVLNPNTNHCDAQSADYHNSDVFQTWICNFV